MISEAPQWQSYKDAPIKGNRFKRFFKSLFRYVDYPFIMAYRGFGSPQALIIQGHVFRGMAMTRPSKKKKSLKNFINLIKRFLVKTVAGAEVELRLPNGKTFTQKTNDNGFYQFEIKQHELENGWQKAALRLNEVLVENQEKVEAHTDILITDKVQYGIISDIDDTLLVSHITKRFRKFYLLITRNSESRKPFEGTVELYQKLNRGTQALDNPFFFVSSSEWNLYDFLVRFMQFHKVPKGVLMLKELKDHWSDFLTSGYRNHNHKIEKIKRLLHLYPESKFILIGDNGQHDTIIYKKIVADYPGRIKAIYIRKVSKKRAPQVEEILSRDELKDVPTLQFVNSNEAEQHARNLGLIS